MEATLEDKHKKFRVNSLFNFYTIAMASGVFLLFCFLMATWVENPNGIANLYLLMLLQVTPFAISFTRQHYNYVAFILCNHFITYSMAKYNQLVTVYKSVELFPETVNALREHITCTLILLGAYHISRQLFFFRFVHKERLQMLSLSRGQLLAVAAYVISIPIIGESVPDMFLALHFAAMAADMVLLLCSDSPGNERMAKYMRGAVFVSTFWYFLQTGFLSLIGNLATYLFITGCLQKNWRTIMLPIFLGIFASAIQTVKAPFRVMVYATPEMNIVERVGLLSELLADHYIGDLLENSNELDEESGENVEDKEGLAHGFARVGDDSLERVMAWTPSRVPFWNGETYNAIPFMFIPRFLWPNKPSRHVWNKFGRVYGYLSSEDMSTSVSVGYLAEGYMNFGLTGLYLSALFVGFFIALIERISYYFLGGYFYFTYVCFLMPLMQPSSDICSMIMSSMIISSVLALFRTQFVKMARKDEYS